MGERQGSRRLVLAIALAGVAVGFGHAAPADAQGFLDKLNKAAGDALRSLESVTEQLQQGQTTGSSGSTAPADRNGKCGALGAGCLTALDDYSGCLRQGAGHTYGMLADRIQAKLASGAGFKAGQRGLVEEDLRALTAASSPPYKFVPPDPKNRNRHWQWLTSAEAHEVNTETIRFNEKLRPLCEAKYGGMQGR